MVGDEQKVCSSWGPPLLQQFFALNIFKPSPLQSSFLSSWSCQHFHHCIRSDLPVVLTENFHHLQQDQSGGESCFRLLAKNLYSHHLTYLDYQCLCFLVVVFFDILINTISTVKLSVSLSCCPSCLQEHVFIQLQILILVLYSSCLFYRDHMITMIIRRYLHLVVHSILMIL